MLNLTDDRIEELGNLAKTALQNAQNAVNCIATDALAENGINDTVLEQAKQSARQHFSVFQDAAPELNPLIYRVTVFAAWRGITVHTNGPVSDLIAKAASITRKKDAIALAEAELPFSTWLDSLDKEKFPIVESILEGDQGEWEIAKFVFNQLKGQQ
jgi:hypothetical protein